MYSLVDRTPLDALKELVRAPTYEHLERWIVTYTTISIMESLHCQGMKYTASFEYTASLNTKTPEINGQSTANLLITPKPKNTVSGKVVEPIINHLKYVFNTHVIAEVFNGLGVRYVDVSAIYGDDGSIMIRTTINHGT